LTLVHAPPCWQSRAKILAHQNSGLRA
jgi:hypothetical protein